jgi:predicted HAD superfamily Cof-like phosphohydrolase
MKDFLNVLQFHKTVTNVDFPEFPTIASLEVAKRRLALLREEYTELLDAIADGDIVKIADGLADLKYVINGTAIEYGIDLPVIDEEVHRSNMTKVGGRTRPDGKILKPPSYVAPKIDAILLNQKSIYRYVDKNSI